MSAPVSYPPASSADIDAYPDADAVEGYLSYEAGDPEPGPNRAPGFRWGWANRRRDKQSEDDGFDWLRRRHLAERRARAAGIKVKEVGT